MSLQRRNVVHVSIQQALHKSSLALYEVHITSKALPSQDISRVGESVSFIHPIKGTLDAVLYQCPDQCYAKSLRPSYCVRIINYTTAIQFQLQISSLSLFPLNSLK